MKKVFTFFILLGLAILLGSLMAKDTGYVLIAYRTLRIETSLWIAIALLILLFIFFYIIMRFLYHTKILPHRLKRWNSKIRQKQMSKIGKLALRAYLEENFKVAEKLFSKAIQINPQSLIYYIFAAKSAQAQHRYKNRDTYLSKALQNITDSKFSIQLINAQLCFQANQQKSALHILKPLYKQHSKNPYIVRQLYFLYTQMDDVEQLKILLSPIKKSHAFSTDKIVDIEHNIYKNLLESSHDSIDKLRSIWKEMPKYLQQNVSLLTTYVQYLFDHNEKLVALSLIEKNLKRDWNTSLVKLYSKYVYKNVNIQRQTTQKWLTTHSKDHILFYTIGRLYCHDHQWTQAKHYLEKSIDLSPEPFTYQLLGYVEEQLGHKDNALLCYRNSFKTL
jgi:HemY protein